MFTLLLTLVIGVVQPQAPSAERLTVTPSGPAIEFDLRRLKGPLVRQLAWSPDQTEIYLQTYEANRDASVKQTYHYVIPAAGGEPRAVDVPPGWAVAYHQWKSGQASPDDPSWKIDVSTEKKIQSATSIPMGGDMARGGTVDPTGGISVESVTAAAAQSTNVNIYTMRLAGQIVGEWENHPIVPGQTFGWAPKGSWLIAFVTKGGALTIMDRAGKLKTVEGSKDAVLPAWSGDAARLAYLEKTGRTTYTLRVVSVGGR